MFQLDPLHSVLQSGVALSECSKAPGQPLPGALVGWVMLFVLGSDANDAAPMLI